MNLDSNDSTYDNIRQGTDIYIHNVPPRYRLSKFSAQIIRFQSSYIQDLRTWSTRTRCGMRNASPALSASSQSAHRVSWPRVRTSTVLPATKRSLPRNASTASRYKHRRLSFSTFSYHPVVFDITIKISAFPSPSPLEGSATRTSHGTPSVSCAKPAINLWQELASLLMRTTFTAWTATRLMWPRSAMAARTQ